MTDDVGRLRNTLDAVAPQDRYDRSRSPTQGRRHGYVQQTPATQAPEGLSQHEQELIRHVMQSMQPGVAPVVASVADVRRVAQTQVYASAAQAAPTNLGAHRPPMVSTVPASVQLGAAAQPPGPIPAAGIVSSMYAMPAPSPAPVTANGAGYSTWPTSVGHVPVSYGTTSSPGYGQPPAAYPAGYGYGPATVSMGQMPYMQAPTVAPPAPAPTSVSNQFSAGYGYPSQGTAAYGDGHAADSAGYRGYPQAPGPDRNRFNPGLWRLRYNGSNVALTNYLGQLEAVAAREGWTDEDMGVVLLSSLEGVATQVIANLPPQCASYSVISQKLREMFAPAANVRAYEKEFRARRRKVGESSSEYALALQGLGRKAYPSLGPDDFQDKLVTQFIEGQPHYISYVMSTFERRTLEEAVAATVSVEMTAQSRQAPQPPQTPRAGRRATSRQASIWEAQPPTPPVSYADPAAQPADYGQPATAQAQETVPEEESEDDFDEEGYDATVAGLIAQLAGIELPGSALCSAATGAGAGRPCYFREDTGHFWLQCPGLLRVLRSKGFKGNLPDFRQQWQPRQIPPRGPQGQGKPPYKRGN